MSLPAAGLLDTSIFIARETGRPIGELPNRVALSIVTIGELHLGVLSAPDDLTRARRAETLTLAKRADPFPITESVILAWAEIVHDCRQAGVHRTIKLRDSLIAATAIEHGLPVVTQDDDYEQISRACPYLTVIGV